MNDMKRLAGRLALVTGASRGIGRAAALALAREGAHVILLARTVGGLEEADDAIRAEGGAATLVTMDLSQAEKVDQLGPSIYQRWGKLDILVGNAGILGPLSPLPHITSDTFASVIDINLTANWRLMRTLDPLLRRSDAGRAIFVSSGAARMHLAYWGPYSAAKAGLEALARVWAAELASTPVKVNIIDPGPIRTGMRAKAFPGENPATLKTPEDIAPLFVELADPKLTETARIYEFAGKEPA
jgi:NAD(P)-dependent dehydrogenase (short-subunit alcohol dehydrogenase family)